VGGSFVHWRLQIRDWKDTPGGDDPDLAVNLVQKKVK